MNQFKSWPNFIINKSIIGAPVTALPFDLQVQTILKWASARQSHFVCVANVHMLMEAYWHSDFSRVLKDAGLVTPDGMPLVWMLKLLGAKNQNRVAGMDIFLALCHQAEITGIPVFFLGSQKHILNQMRLKLEREFPLLQVSAMEPLPFRPLSLAENEAMLEKINCSGAGLVFISLGCPKQEYWMHQNQGRVNAVMIGLGGVFPVYAGIYRRAPTWMQNAGLEWFFRLIQEPRRLWKRYWKTNFPFIYLAFRQIIFELVFDKSRLRRVQ